jgi:hypothetical protein
MRPGIGLPDDLEQQYAKLRAIMNDMDLPLEVRHAAMHQVQAWHREWREGIEQHLIRWDERRRIRALNPNFGPITPDLGMEANARMLKRQECMRKAELRERRRLIRKHGRDGATAILNLRDRLQRVRNVPDARAIAWAEQKYERGEVLTPGYLQY